MDTEKLQKIISNLAAEIGNLNIRLASANAENEKLKEEIANLTRKNNEQDEVE